MNDDPNARLFEALDPPRGGLAGLHARIERDGRRRVRGRRMRLALAGCAVLLLLLSIPTFGPARPSDPLADELQLARMRLGLEPAPSEALTIPAADRHRVAARRVPLGTDRVLLYRIGTIGSVVGSGFASNPDGG